MKKSFYLHNVGNISGKRKSLPKKYLAGWFSIEGKKLYLILGLDVEI